MVRKTLFVTLALVLVGTAAQAQQPRFEISATAGWTFSDGVSGQAVTVPEGTFNRVDPKDSFSWGARFGYLLNQNSEVGFLFNMQPTDLEVSGSRTVTLGSENIYNYHGYFAYSFLDTDAKARPYVLIGLGATQYGGVDASLGDERASLDGDTQFSGTGAVGVKLFPFASPMFGLRAEARWTPTYIKSDPSGWWCGYWGCYVTQDAQYANQWEFSGGIILRF
jgi:hypothetical protein